MQGKGIATLSIGYNTLLIFTPEHFYEEIQRELRKTYDQANKKQGAVQEAPCFRKEYLQKNTMLRCDRNYSRHDRAGLVLFRIDADSCQQSVTGWVIREFARAETGSLTGFTRGEI